MRGHNRNNKIASVLSSQQSTKKNRIAHCCAQYTVLNVDRVKGGACLQPAFNHRNHQAAAQ
jgi:hypothetical protein